MIQRFNSEHRTGERTVRANKKTRPFARRAMTLAMLGLSAGLVGCDFDVINPGPVEDRFLDNSEAHEAVIAGIARMFADGLDNVAMTGGAVVRETFPSGSTGSFGISAFQQRGIIFYDDVHVDWTEQQRARWMAEDAVRRFSESEDVADVNSYGPAAQAALWAGYANRLLGENYCQAIIDGGDALPRSAFFERAEEWFGRAAQIGQSAGLSDVVNAAYAGRASVRLDQGNWSGAVADAGLVPDGFVFQAEYNTLDQEQFNRMYWAGAGQPYRSFSVWNTQWDEYYSETGDPRVSWRWRLRTDDNTFFDGTNPPADLSLAGTGDAGVAIVAPVLPDEKVPQFEQTKYPREASNITLSSKLEMNLIVAENHLRNGDHESAMDLLNARRTSLGLDALAPADLDEAWTLFKRERGAELWLEARRMWDLTRWAADGAPGDLHPKEILGGAESFLTVASRAGESNRCYPIPRAERESNPNLPLTP